MSVVIVVRGRYVELGTGTPGEAVVSPSALSTNARVRIAVDEPPSESGARLRIDRDAEILLAEYFIRLPGKSNAHVFSRNHGNCGHIVSLCGSQWVYLRVGAGLPEPPLPVTHRCRNCMKRLRAGTVRLEEWAGLLSRI